MGAFLVYYVVASIVAIPFLGYLLLRTRRDLSALRAELAARGVIADDAQHVRVAGGSVRGDARAVGGGMDDQPVARRERLAPMNPPDDAAPG